MNILYHSYKTNIVADALSRMSMGSIDHAEDGKKKLAEEVHQFARLGICLLDSAEETLVHYILEHCDDSDFTFSILFSMKEHVVYVNQRPHLWTFLERVAEIFEVVIFTTTQSIYAKNLDPDGKIISRCAYRESCIL
ncbi:hypothetical protein BC332_18710 [Capsicum chinense]|nr:hypothetical protein BC332_18710 [Capsicum chinense]